MESKVLSAGHQGDCQLNLVPRTHGNLQNAARVRVNLFGLLCVGVGGTVGSLNFMIIYLISALMRRPRNFGFEV